MGKLSLLMTIISLLSAQIVLFTVITSSKSDMATVTRLYVGSLMLFASVFTGVWWLVVVCSLLAAYFCGIHPLLALASMGLGLYLCFN